MNRISRLKAVFLPALLIVSFLGGCSKEPSVPLKEEGKTLLVSDLHYYSPSLTDYGAKFQEIMEEADGKDPEHQEAFLKALKDEISKGKYDSLVLNGDLTFNGEKASFDGLISYLDGIEKEGTKVYVLPGNHDVGFYRGFSCFGDTTENVTTFTQADFKENLSRFGYGSAVMGDSNSFSYLSEMYQGVYGLFLDANSGIENAFESTTVAFIRKALEYVKEKGGKAVAFTHQPLLSHLGSSSLDARPLLGGSVLSLFKEYGVKLNFAGHLHILNRKENEGVAEIANPCLSLLNNQYGVISYTKDGNLSYECESLDPSKYVSSLEGYSSFREYSEERYKKIQKEKILASKDAFATETGADELSLLGDYFASVNVDSFEGNLVHVDETDEGYLAWKNQIDSFYREYVGKILSDFRLETDYHAFQTAL